MSALSNIAPYQSCVSCLRGDVTTGFNVEGEAEFLIAALIRVGVPRELAEVMVLDHAHDYFGCDQGSVPEEDMNMGIRVCASCARGITLQVLTPGQQRDGVVRSGEKVDVYVQPDWLRA